jgi:probable rRNA maturation factor
LTFPFAYLYHENIGDCENLGDIFLCYPLVKNQSQEFQSSFNEEICLIFTHGMLHLLGYEHQKKDEKKIMFNLQDKIIAEIN